MTQADADEAGSETRLTSAEKKELASSVAIGADWSGTGHN